jgi:hypothetical protein
MIIALIALSFALGGTGYAATSFVASGGPGAHSATKHAASKRGPRGLRGKTGPRGPIGLTGANGAAGAQGAQGAKGETGPAGEPGTPAPSQYAEFFALMPPDNAATVAVGSAVEFPHDGPHKGAIVRSGPGTFVLPDIGTYRIAFSVSVTEAGQLVLNLDSTELPYTVYGRATGTNQIAGDAFVTTTASNSVLSVDNASGNSTALTITPLAGGTHAAVASLIIQQLS